MQKLLTFFQQNNSIFAIFNDQSFNDLLTNDIVNFERLGLDVQADPSDWRAGGRGFNPRRGRQHSFVEIDH